MTNGYAGKIAFVNLTNQTVREEPTEAYSEWIGGRSLGTYLLSRQPDLFSNDPAQQPIIISMGPLVGSPISMGVRTAVSARNLQSGGISYSNVGGDFGSRARAAGFDALVILGASIEPVALHLELGRIQFLPALDLWGMTISHMQAAFLKQYDPQHTSFIGIGPAGEQKLLISCLMVDQAHAAGWGGSGAIFGAKKLKAIVAVGTESVSFYAPQELVDKSRQILWRINASEAAAGLARGGTHGMAGAGGSSGLVPTGVRNIQDEYQTPEESAPIREEAFKKWEVERAGCLGCGIRCMHRYQMDSASYGHIDMQGMHANSVRGFGSNLGITDQEALLVLHTLCNDFGLDVDGVASCLAFALECADYQILDRDQPGDVRLEWGNGKGMVRLVHQMVHGEGLGQVLRNGVAEAAHMIGRGSETHAVMIKNVGINEQGIRSHRAWALGLMVSNRGGGHLGGSPQTENRRMSADAGMRLFENPHVGEPHSYEGKGKLAAWTEGIKAIIDSLGLCYFIYGWYDVSFGSPDELAELLNLATGMHLSGKELHWRGLRTHTLERLLSYRLAGFSRKDDYMPERFFNTSVSSGPYQGAHLEHEPVEAMLDEYYKTLDWEVETGLPGASAIQRYQLRELFD